MKVKKSILPLLVISAIGLTSCKYYPYYEAGIWQSEDSFVYAEAGITIESMRVEIYDNEDPDFVYDEFNRWTDDGGEYVPDMPFIIYIYLDDTLVFDLFGYSSMNGYWYESIYQYDDKYDIEIQLRFTEPTNKKASYFEAKTWLTPYRNNDPYSYDRSQAERTTPSVITLYKV